MIRNWNPWKRTWLAATTVATVCVAAIAIGAQEGKNPKPDRALERTRKTVRMLDDIYKMAVVLITDKCHEHYEQAQEGEPIGMLSYTLKIE